MNNYDDIIDLDRPKSGHPKLSMESRAAQFSPFAALTGYDEKIKESARVTEKKKELSNEEKDILNNKLMIISNNINKKDIINITYFVKDKYKNGGKYYSKDCIIRRIDLINKKLILDDKSIINMDDIIDINGDMFREYY